MNYKRKNADKNLGNEHSFPRERIECFSSRLQKALGDEKPRAFAQRSSFSEGAIRSYLSGDTYPALDRLEQIAEFLDVEAEWLAFGKGEREALRDQAHQESGYLQEPDEFVYIEQMVTTQQGVTSRRHAVRADWLAAQGLDPSQLSVLETREDSMVPTIHPGDLLLCETYLHRPEGQIKMGLAPGELPPNDGTYLIRLGDKGSTAIRRLRLDMNGGLFVLVDADADARLHLTEEQLSKLKLSIMARVVMLQRTL